MPPRFCSWRATRPMVPDKIVRLTCIAVLALLAGCGVVATPTPAPPAPSATRPPVAATNTPGGSPAAQPLTTTTAAPATNAPVPAGTPTAPPNMAVAPAWVRDAVLYQIFVRAFTPEGTLAAAQKRLPDLKDLGVNL